MVELSGPTRAADEALTQLASGLHLVLDLTPTDQEEQLAEWVARRRPPTFSYRPLSVDPDDVRRRIDRIDLDAGEHPAVRRLLARRADELHLQCELLAQRCQPGFLETSERLLGGCDDDLRDLAEQLLEEVAPGPPDLPVVGPDTFAARCEEEVRRYREQLPDFQGEVVVRDDVPSLMVVQRTVIVGSDAWTPEHRVEALVHHEVGTHLLTAETGGRQPLHLLEQGTADHEETQEALAVLAEHQVGGLDADRLRVLAGRAAAVRCLQDGADFDQIVAHLEARRIPAEKAWTIAARVVRSGGYTKDVIYLRGLVRLLEHLQQAEIDSLLVGKVSLADLADVEVLLDEGVLSPAAVRPHWLSAERDGQPPGRGRSPLSAPTPAAAPRGR